MKNTSLIYGNTVISNRCQTLAYIKAGLPDKCWDPCSVKTDDCCCMDAAVLDEEFGLDAENLADVYVDPVTDQAPWIDPANPCSEQFFGFITNEVRVGNPFKRRVKDTLSGGFIQSKNLNSREVIVRGWIVASSECGTQYGVDWLQNALDPDKCGSSGCDLPDLAFAVCCDPADRSKGTRILRGVAPVQGVTDLEPNSNHRCCRTEVEIKFAAQDPHFWSPKKTEVEDRFISASPRPNWCCPDCSPDIAWPDCLEPEVNRSISTSSEGDCFCEPAFVYKSLYQHTPAGLMPEFIDWTLNATTDLENVSVEWVEELPGVTGNPFSNPQGYECAERQRTTIAFIPAGFSLTLDSSANNIVLTDPTGVSTAAFGIGGGQRIRSGCDGGYVCVAIDVCNDNLGIRYDVCSSVGVL